MRLVTTAGPRTPRLTGLIGLTVHALACSPSPAQNNAADAEAGVTGVDTATESSTTTGSVGETVTEDTSSATSSTSEPAGTETAAASSTGDECGDVLSDPENCGACRHFCFGGVCEDGECEATKYPVDGLLGQDRVNEPFTVAADEDGIYFHARAAVLGAEGLFRMDRDGSEPEFLATGWSDRTAIYPRGEYVYAYTAACCTGPGAHVYEKVTSETRALSEGIGTEDTWLGEDLLFSTLGDSVRLSGTNLDSTIASAGTRGGYFLFVTGNSTHAFVLESMFTEAQLLTFRIADAQQFEPLPLQPMATFPQDVENTGINDIIATDDAVFVASDRIQRVELSTMEVADFTEPGTRVDNLAIHSERLYWVQDGIEIRSQLLRGGAIETSVESDSLIRGIWVDDLGLVWTTGDSNSDEPGFVWQRAHTVSGQ